MGASCSGELRAFSMASITNSGRYSISQVFLAKTGDLGGILL